MKALPAAGIALLLCPSSPPLAQTERELDAHEHGAASLDVALDGARLYLDFRSPAANVLGFEHAPSTAAERDALDAARALLGSAEPFTLDASADCALESAEVDIELEPEDSHGGGHSDIGTSHVFSAPLPNVSSASRRRCSSASTASRTSMYSSSDPAGRARWS